tara:strand:+ start:3782 stop:4015 length:234 start_codon:yes stop_codon:yes gene_type:complete
MDIVSNVQKWVGKIADLGVSLLALTIVAELLGLGAVPFMPNGVSVIDNVSGVVESLGSSGLVGLLAVWVLWMIWKNK